MDGLEIDVEQVLYGKNPKLRKVVPGFFVRYLKKIVHRMRLMPLSKPKDI